jgi:V8-like Glu-specific endopeptidase
MGYLNEDADAAFGALACGPGCGCQSQQRTVSGLAQYYEPEEPGATAGVLQGVGFGAFAQTPASTPLTRVADATVPPWRAVCRIVARENDAGFSVGSGVLIAPYHVLTCAHVIFPPQAPRTREITVYPGQNGADDTARGIKANGWAVSPGWRMNDCATAGEDYGIIRLPQQHGYIPLIPFSAADLLSVLVTMAGYPSSRSHAAREMFFSRGHVLGGIVMASCTATTMDGRLVPSIPATTNLVGHDVQSDPSMSGSPMWFMKDTRRLAAIHAGTVAGGTIRKAIVMNDRVRAQIRQWLQQTLPPGVGARQGIVKGGFGAGRAGRGQEGGVRQ